MLMLRIGIRVRMLNDNAINDMDMSKHCNADEMANKQYWQKDLYDMYEDVSHQ